MVFSLDDFSWKCWFVSNEGKFVWFSEEDGVTYVCLHCVVSSLRVVSPLANSC